MILDSMNGTGQAFSLNEIWERFIKTSFHQDSKELVGYVVYRATIHDESPLEFVNDQREQVYLADASGIPEYVSLHLVPPGDPFPTCEVEDVPAQWRE
jgi:hypothetical protein